MLLTEPLRFHLVKHMISINHTQYLVRHEMRKAIDTKNQAKIEDRKINRKIPCKNQSMIKEIR
jgi:hypothetical protein